MFKERATEPELMDDLTLSGEALRQNLRELEFINQWLGGHAVVRQALNRLVAPPFWARFPENRLKVADLGSGGGDTLKMVADWARQHNLSVELVGLDANAFMIDYATAHCHGYPEISFRQADVFSEAVSYQHYDVVICSLFLHHFRNEALVSLFSRFKKQIGLAVVVNDLHRHALAYYSIKSLTQLFSRSYLVKNDAPLSVKRAFSRADWENILRQAGVKTYELRWRWAFRWQLVFGPFLEK